MVVADFSHGVAGPFCSLMLADLGAEVVKIERPQRGDGSRYMSVSERFAGGIPVEGGDYFLSINRNKRSVALDLKQPQGLRIAERLMATADIAVENFSGGVMDRLGLGYEAARETNPALIYCSIRAYGDSGPLADEVGMDVAVQARSGVMRVTGHPGSTPIKPGASLADLAGGLHAALGAVAAVVERNRTGSGQKVDVSLLDATAMMLINYSVPILNSDVELLPMGSGHPQLVPFQAFETADDWVIVAAGTNARWRRFCEAIDADELARDPRFETNAERVRNRDALLPELEARIREATTDEWIQEFNRRGVPCAPVLTLRDAFEHEHLAATGMVRSVDHPTLGPLRMFGNPIRLSDHSADALTPPPRLGQHSREVLTGMLGISEQEYERLRGEGTVGDPAASSDR